MRHKYLPAFSIKHQKQMRRLTKSTIAPKMSAELKNVVSKMSPKFFRAASTTNKKSLIF